MSDEKPPGFEEVRAEFNADYDERSAAADADVAEGRVVPNDRVTAWLQSIIGGKPEPAPFSHYALPSHPAAPGSAHE